MPSKLDPRARAIHYCAPVPGDGDPRILTCVGGGFLCRFRHKRKSPYMANPTKIPPPFSLCWCLKLCEDRLSGEEDAKFSRASYNLALSSLVLTSPTQIVPSRGAIAGRLGRYFKPGSGTRCCNDVNLFRRFAFNIEHVAPTKYFAVIRQVALQ